MTESGASVPVASAGLDTQHRDDVLQLGLWAFLATVVMLFAAFSSAYIVRRGGSDWLPTSLPAIIWANTLVLVGSSVALEVGRLGSRRQVTRGLRYGLAAATVLGAGFVTGQGLAWRAFAGAGTSLAAAYGGFVYILTGLHALHVVAGLVALVYATVQAWRAPVGPLLPDRLRRTTVGAATFWHFLTVLWLYVLVLVSVYR